MRTIFSGSPFIMPKIAGNSGKIQNQSQEQRENPEVKNEYKIKFADVRRRQCKRYRSINRSIRAIFGRF